MITIAHKTDELVIRVHKNMFDGLTVDQGDDMIYINEDSIREFVAAVRTVASHILGEEV